MKALNEEEKKNKLKAIDLNTESLKLYVTISFASIAGLVAYHNSPNIIHNDSWFYCSIVSLFTCAVISLFTLNSFIAPIDRGEINVHNKSSIRFNFIAILIFTVAIICIAIYFLTSPKKVESPTNSTVKSGILIQGNNIILGNDVKTKINITKDSLGNIREINIP